MNSGWKSFIEKLNTKYRLVILRDNTLQEKLSFKVSRLNVYFLGLVLATISALLTFLLIALTPLKEYIPGYQDVHTRRNVLDLTFRTDSLQHVLRQQRLFIDNIQKVIGGQDIATNDIMPNEEEVEDAFYDTLELNRRSQEDSLLREQMENEQYYALLETDANDQATSISEINFHKPLQGLVSSEFDPSTDHFGIDVVGREKEPVMAVMDGVVIFQDWTLDTGYVIGVQHEYDLVSFYKHNSVLLKKIGNTVEAGDAIAIVGDSGHQTTGPHLHFEMWYKQKPVNPLDYLNY